MTQIPFIFQIPAGLTAAEQARLQGLAGSCWGTPEGNCYVFTPAKGKKFVALWNGGFRYHGEWHPQCEKKARRTFTHPSSRRVLPLSAALKLAKQLAAKGAS